MKKLMFIAAATIVAFSSTAQNDAAAKKVLDGVSAKVKASKGITANITLKSISAKGKDMGVQSGTMRMKADKYLLNKGKTEVLCDGKNIYTYDGSKTITVATVEESSASLSPQKLLSGSYDKDFNYKLVNSKGNSFEIDVKPIDNRKNFVKATLFIDKVKNMITKAKVQDKSNNITELIIANLNTSAVLPDKDFQFNKAKYPKDVELLD